MYHVCSPTNGACSGYLFAKMTESTSLVNNGRKWSPVRGQLIMDHGWIPASLSGKMDGHGENGVFFFFKIDSYGNFDGN